MAWQAKYGHASRRGGFFDDQQALRFVLRNPLRTASLGFSFDGS